MEQFAVEKSKVANFCKVDRIVRNLESFISYMRINAYKTQ